jgi:hypothetical protein
MKYAFFLILLPAVGFGQDAASTRKGAKPYLIVHFNKMKLRTCGAAPANSDCQKISVYDGDFLLTDTLSTAASVAVTQEGKPAPTCIIEQAAIECNNSKVLKGDRLEYDGARKKGVLKGHVRLSSNGVDEPLGRYALLDLSDNCYKIEKLK